jgi:hypothetical protein
MGHFRSIPVEARQPPALARRYQQTKPPSTIRSTPVQKLAASLSRKEAERPALQARIDPPELLGHLLSFADGRWTPISVGDPDAAQRNHTDPTTLARLRARKIATCSWPGRGRSSTTW